MGYSTHLYSVDIGELKVAFGSKDASLLERVREVVRRRDGGQPRVDPTKGPRVFCNHKSELFLNGEPVPIDQFKQAMLDPKWHGTFVYTYWGGPPRGQQREGPFKEPGSFVNFVALTMNEVGRSLGLERQPFAGIEACGSPQQFAEAGTADDDITEDQAIEELITGKITQPEHAATYGYALEYLVEALGTRLGAVGTDQLKSLKLKTPLSRAKRPVKIPKGDDDFPYISFLDAAETRAEVDRLREMDLSLPSDPENERERRRFLDYLEQAVKHNRGIVGFYY